VCLGEVVVVGKDERTKKNMYSWWRHQKYRMRCNSGKVKCALKGKKNPPSCNSSLFEVEMKDILVTKKERY
jgi:hypothetical protein